MCYWCSSSTTRMHGGLVYRVETVPYMERSAELLERQQRSHQNYNCRCMHRCGVCASTRTRTLWWVPVVTCGDFWKSAITRLPAPCSQDRTVPTGLWANHHSSTCHKEQAWFLASTAAPAPRACVRDPIAHRPRCMAHMDSSGHGARTPAQTQLRALHLQQLPHGRTCRARARAWFPCARVYTSAVWGRLRWCMRECAQAQVQTLISTCVSTRVQEVAAVDGV